MSLFRLIFMHSILRSFFLGSAQWRSITSGNIINRNNDNFFRLNQAQTFAGETFDAFGSLQILQILFQFPIIPFQLFHFPGQFIFPIEQVSNG